MRLRYCFLAAALGVSVVAATPSMASPAEVDLGATMESRLGETTVTFEATVPTYVADGGRIVVRGPRRGGVRPVVKRCELAYTGGGTYGCTVARRRVARHPGRWTATAKIDGTVVVTRTFAFGD